MISAKFKVKMATFSQFQFQLWFDLPIWLDNDHKISCCSRNHSNLLLKLFKAFNYQFGGLIEKCHEWCNCICWKLCLVFLRLWVIAGFLWLCWEWTGDSIRNWIMIINRFLRMIRLLDYNLYEGHSVSAITFLRAFQNSDFSL